MTAQGADLSRSRGRFADRSLHFLVSLYNGPRPCEGGDVHEIVGDHAEADPAVHAVDAMIATAAQAMATFEHTDATFTADAPPLPATEPALTFERAPRWRLRATARQHHATDAAAGRGLFIGRGAEAPIAGGEIRGAAEDHLMPIHRRRPPGDVGRSSRMELLRR